MLFYVCRQRKKLLNQATKPHDRPLLAAQEEPGRVCAQSETQVGERCCTRRPTICGNKWSRYGLVPYLTTLNRDWALRRRWIEVFTEAYSRKGVVAMVVTFNFSCKVQIYHGTLDSKIQRTTSGKKPT